MQILVRAVEITSSHIGDAPVLPCPRSRRTKRWVRSPLMVPMTHANAMTPSPRTRCHSAAEEREALEDDYRRSCGVQRGPACLKIPWSGTLATMERIPSTEPHRNEDALFETSGLAVDGAGLRPPACRAPGPYHSPLSLGPMARHGSFLNGYTALGIPLTDGRWINPSVEKGNLGASPFVQQSVFVPR